MKLDAYLDRIAYHGPLRPDRATLAALHRAHLLAIPYENLDVQLGRPVSTDPAAAYDKIVRRKRGGWCYEMNGLFGWVLSEIGFKVTRAAGAVLREKRGAASEGCHLVLVVELEEGIYLADVGFGDGPLDPIAVTEGEFGSHGFRFALTREPDGWWRFHHHARGGVASFDFIPAKAEERLLSEQCLFLQSSPESPFVQNAVLQHHFADGVWQMRGRVLRKTTPSTQEEFLIADAAEYTGALQEVFGLNLPQAASLWPAICQRHEQVMAERVVESP